MNQDMIAFQKDIDLAAVSAVHKAAAENQTDDMDLLLWAVRPVHTADMFDLVRNQNPPGVDPRDMSEVDLVQYALHRPYTTRLHDRHQPAFCVCWFHISWMLVAGVALWLFL